MALRERVEIETFKVLLYSPVVIRWGCQIDRGRAEVEEGTCNLSVIEGEPGEI